MTQAEKLSEAIKWLDTRWVLHPQNRVPKLKEKKEWVGLTGVEINHIFAANVGYPERMVKEVENLLKEKNT